MVVCSLPLRGRTSNLRFESPRGVHKSCVLGFRGSGNQDSTPRYPLDPSLPLNPPPLNPLETFRFRGIFCEIGNRSAVNHEHDRQDCIVYQTVEPCAIHQVECNSQFRALRQPWIFITVHQRKFYLCPNPSSFQKRNLTKFRKDVDLSMTRIAF